MSRRVGGPGRTLLPLAMAGLVAVALMGAAVGVGRSAPSTGGASTAGASLVPTLGPAGAAAGATGPASGSAFGPGPPGGAGPVEYGLAEPAGTLPGVTSPKDVAAWSQIRADVAGSGACWLRSDLDEWLTQAIAAFPWLGSSAPCSTAPGGPVKVLAILDDQTVWAARRLCPGGSLATAGQHHRTGFSLDDWQELVSCIARQFAGRISAFEIWNEPLLPGSTFGYQDGTPAHYADLLRVAWTAIKAADPRATVIALGGSDLYAGGDAARLADMRAFTTGLLALGAARYADAISLHAYPWGQADPSVLASYQAELPFQAQAWGKPVWITETGTRATDPGSQGAYAQAAYGLFVGAGVRHIFWFSITDQPDGTFGLRGRPVEATLRAFALAHP